MAINNVTNAFSHLTTVAATADTATSKSTAKNQINGTLNQQQFLRLMTTQMTHQDPSKPMENGDFLSQMAQFGTVSGIQDLQKSFSEFSSSIGSGQSLQAASLVGHTVLVPATKGQLETGKSLTGAVDLTDDTTNLTVKVVNSTTGEEIKTLSLGKQVKGSVPFTWDGKNERGELVDPGVYNISAAANIGDKDTALETQVQARVDSVTMGNGSGVNLNLAGVGSVNFNQVKQIL